MLEFLSNYDFTTLQWVIIILSGFLIGIEKAGIPVMLILVPIMAQILGGKLSVGFILPLLIMGDIFAVIYYKRHTKLKNVLKPMPWALIGILIGLFVGNNVSDFQFKKIMAGIVGLCVVLLLLKKGNGKDDIVHKWYFSAITGLLGGFSTMIGNAAGPVMILYFLSLNLNKNSFIGTFAWFFFIMNLIKFPLYALVWQNINWESFTLNLMLWPLIIIGAFVGVRLVKYVPEKPYRAIMLTVTVIGAVKLAL